jgi:hypothetical protein
MKQKKKKEFSPNLHDKVTQCSIIENRNRFRGIKGEQKVGEEIKCK